MPARLRIIAAAALALLAVLCFAGVAFAADDVPAGQPGLGLPSVQFWTAVLASLVPLAGYVINHHAPWVTEPAKFLFTTLLSAAVGVIYPLVQAGTWAFDSPHLQLVGTAVITTWIAHSGWKAGGINRALGGGTNAPDRGTVSG